jgi:hypothetical protein
MKLPAQRIGGRSRPGVSAAPLRRVRIFVNASAMRPFQRAPRLCRPSGNGWPDSFTVADVYLGSGIGFGMQFGVIERRPAFERYCRRPATRPAALRAKEIDDTIAAQPWPPAG